MTCERATLRLRIRAALLVEHSLLVTSRSRHDISTMGLHYVVDRRGRLVERDVDIVELAKKLGVAGQKPRGTQPLASTARTVAEQSQIGASKADQLVAELRGGVAAPAQPWRCLVGLADDFGWQSRACSGFVNALGARAAARGKP